jgi:predicted amidohydrolase
MMNLKRLLAITSVFLFSSGIALAQNCKEYNSTTRPDVTPATAERYLQHYKAHGHKPEEGMCNPSGSSVNPGPAGCTVYSPQTRPDVVPATQDRYLQHYNVSGHRAVENMCPPSGATATSPGTTPAGPAGCTVYSPQTRPDVVPATQDRYLQHYNESGHRAVENMCTPSGATATSPGTTPAGPAGCTVYSPQTRPDVVPATQDRYLQHYNESGHRAVENMCPPSGATATAPQPDPNPNTGNGTALNIPVGNWAYMDDAIANLDGSWPQVNGDPNSAQDLVLILALAVHFNSLPKFIGVTHVDGVLGTAAVRKILNASGLNIPILEGASGRSAIENGAPPSTPLSRAIAAESKKGEFKLAVGGPTSDIATAIRVDGANTRNLVTAITRHTTNERISGGATEYVVARVRNIPTPENDLVWMLGKDNNQAPKVTALLPSGKRVSPTEWIQFHKSLPVFAAGFSAGVVKGCRDMNTFMDRFEDGNPFRMADWHHHAALFGVSSSARDHHWKIINRGLTLMKNAQR